MAIEIYSIKSTPENNRFHFVRAGDILFQAFTSDEDSLVRIEKAESKGFIVKHLDEEHFLLSESPHRYLPDAVATASRWCSINKKDIERSIDLNITRITDARS